jgi:hypothetical protein
MAGALEKRIVGKSSHLFEREAQVHGRVARNSPKSVEISHRAISAREQFGAQLVRRARAALVVGTGLAALGFLAFGPGLAVAGRSGSGERALSQRFGFAVPLAVQ